LNASTRSAVQLRIPFPEAQGEYLHVARDLTKDIDRRRLEHPTAGLYALLKLWVLAAFAGASAVASAVATVIDGRQPLRFGVVLAGIVLGSALTWYAIRRMKMLLERFDEPSTGKWIED
jgi:hypothetical protein